MCLIQPCVLLMRSPQVLEYRLVKYVMIQFISVVSNWQQGHR